MVVVKVRENPADGYYAKNFRELRVCKAARSLAKDIKEARPDYSL